MGWLSELCNIFYLAVTTGSVFLCLLISLMTLHNKNRELTIYEKHKSILVFEVLLLSIGFFATLWFSLKIIVLGGL